MSGIREGEILAGKYRVERVLGVGGMGVVVAAHHMQLDERVAIKFLLPSMLESADAVGRFAREARAAVKIKSEHVARILDVGTLDTGAPYLVMEYLDGGDLAAWIAQRGPLPIEQAVEFVLQACVAVAEAHALGIVHRDLKPANLFCVRGADGRLMVKVLDFGISKLTSAAALGALTRTHTIMGSPLYMSPEQMTSAKNVDGRTDIWALGVVLFELMTGRVPFSGDSMPEIVLKVASATPATLRTFRPDAPEALQTVLLTCLQKDPAARYANVAELAAALLPFAPRQAKAYVERVGGIIQSAGLSASALSLPPSPPVLDADTLASPTAQPPRVAHSSQGASKWTRTGTAPALSGTVPGGRPRQRRAVAALAGAALFVAVAIGVGAAVHATRRAPFEAAAQSAAAQPAAAPSVAEASSADAPFEPVLVNAGVHAGADASALLFGSGGREPLPAAPARALRAASALPAHPQTPATAVASPSSRPTASSPQAAPAGSGTHADPNALFGLQPK